MHDKSRVVRSVSHTPITKKSQQQKKRTRGDHQHQHQLRTSVCVGYIKKMQGEIKRVPPRTRNKWCYTKNPTMFGPRCCCPCLQRQKDKIYSAVFCSRLLLFSANGSTPIYRPHEPQSDHIHWGRQLYWICGDSLLIWQDIIWSRYGFFSAVLDGGLGKKRPLLLLMEIMSTEF